MPLGPPPGDFMVGVVKRVHIETPMVDLSGRSVIANLWDTMASNQSTDINTYSFSPYPSLVLGFSNHSQIQTSRSQMSWYGRLQVPLSKLKPVEDSLFFSAESSYKVPPTTPGW